ncbi:PIR protein [Plasmodium vivax]|uniref:VIR protein n=1 Tax=Plasmodium vivax TaxID=5855 RepID=A0A564ZVK4_PLAVI|nr:PIR protein [Plasmodium vivax]
MEKKSSFLLLIFFWDTYNQFESPVEGDGKKYMYEIVCNLIMKELEANEDKNNNFCLKLVRNLGFYTPHTQFFDPRGDRCMILQYWVYNSEKNQQIPKNIITGCFNDYKSQMSGSGNKPKCDYYPYEGNYKEPINIIILDIFQNNMEIVKDIVATVSDKINIGLQNYICECVKIYKEMDEKYCRNKGEEQKRDLTCSMLDAVKRTYESYLPVAQHEHYKIPSLGDVEKKYTDICSRTELQVPLNAPRLNEESALSSFSENRNGQGDESSSPKPFMDENPGSSMTRTVSTAVGTMAGASSVLALLYKFTPGRNWIRSGIRGSRGRISNNLHAEQPNELFYDGFEGEVMSSHNPTYNVGYGSV